MAVQEVKIPFINPLQWYLDEPEESERFLSKDFVDWLLPETILPWQQKLCWNQPWQHSDTIHDQIQSTYGPLNLRIYKSDDSLIDTIPYNQLAQNASDPRFWLYEIDVSMSIYPEGLYYCKLEFGNPVALRLRSNSIYVAARIENSLLLECQHYKFREDVIFETDILLGMRVPGIKKYKSTPSKDTVYENQVLDIETLRSVNFRLWELRIGLARGIPDYVADKISRMLGCSRFLIDGKEYTKNEGAKMERIELERYPLSAWTVEMREKRNRASRYYQNETAQNASIVVMLNVDSKGFGADTGGNETVITNVD